VALKGEGVYAGLISQVGVGLGPGLDLGLEGVFERTLT
jgi:hypothetical protein